MKIEFLEVAEQELYDIVEYYNQQSEGLGFEFALELQKTIDRIIQYPDAWPKLSNRTRRCRCNRFPFGVIYTVRKDLVLIVAIMHLMRKPGYWKNRI